MRKFILLLILTVIATPTLAQGYRAMTKDDARILVFSGNEVVYTRLSLPLKCTYKSSSRGIDDKGLSFKADGFSCTDSLFVVLKTWLDIDLKAIIEVDPKTEKSQSFKVDFYKEYE